MKTFLEIFFVFVKIGALTFGGGYSMLPLLQSDAADRRGWVTDREITDYFAVAQCLPGIIMVNTAMLVGHKRGGAAGMIAAALGAVFPSLVVITIVAMFLPDILKFEAAAYAFNGIRVCVLALITGAALRMWKSGVKDIYGILIFAASLIMLTFTNLSPAFPVVAGALCGIVIKERKAR